MHSEAELRVVGPYDLQSEQCDITRKLVKHFANPLAKICASGRQGNMQVSSYVSHQICVSH